MMIYIIGIILGLYVGMLSHNGDGYLVGAVIGILVAYLIKLKERVQKLEGKLDSLNFDQQKTKAEQASKTPSNSGLADNLAEEDEKIELPITSMAHSFEFDELSIKSSDLINQQPEKMNAIESIVEKGDVNTETKSSISNIEDAQQFNFSQANENHELQQSSEEIGRKNTADSEPSIIENIFSKIKSLITGYFTGGNSLVRTGLLVLFVGVAFLLKYVAERTTVPIEFRYIGIALACLVMLTLGWKLKSKRPGYALSLLGGGIGVLYLTLFAAMRLHGLLSPKIVIILLIAIVVLSAILAILTNSMALAVIGMIGGYAAPILTSTGTGSHVQLFSYYLLLNVGVFVIAWFKSWRILNVIGFVATFGIGSLWGYKYYKPDFLWSVEPFLIINFLMYTLIAILFAIKQPLHLKGINDGTLIFGTPLVGFSLQAALMQDTEYGLAYSALALGVFYVLLSFIIHKTNKPYFKNLIESFIALGIGFATLAIPLGFDGRVTSAMWVAEGSALVWVGIRQARMFPRFSGYALTLLGSIAFFLEKTSNADLIPWLNANFMGTLIITAATAFIGLYARAHAAKLLSIEVKFIPASMLIYALVWWLFGGIHEINQYYFIIRFSLIQVLLVLTTLLLLLAAKKSKYELLTLLAFVVTLGQLLVLSVLPQMKYESFAFFNDRFIGLMVLSLFHFVMSWYWRSTKQYFLASLKMTLTLLLSSSILVWLFAFVTEIRFYYAFDEFALIELLMAATAVVLLTFGIIKKTVHYKVASVAVTLMMLIPLQIAPAANSALPMLFNVSFIGYVIYALTHLSMAWYWQRKIHSTDVTVNLWNLHASNAMLVFGLLAWFIRGIKEISIYTVPDYFIPIDLVFITVSVLILVLIAHKLLWKYLHYIKYTYLPMLALAAVYVLMMHKHFHDGYGMFVWLVAAFFFYWLLRIYEKSEFKYLNIYHIIGLFLFAFIVILEWAEWVDYSLGKTSIWHKASYSFMLIVLSTVLYQFKNFKRWPIAQHYEAYIKQALPLFVVISWVLMTVLNLLPPGKLKSMPYIPILNAIDLTALLTLGLSSLMLKHNASSFYTDSKKPIIILLAGLGFLLLNASMLRCFHYWYGIDYDWSSMMASSKVQTGFSILWTLTAVVLMVMSAHKKWRTEWLVGLGLIIAVIVKLFLIDMSASGTIERIVAFLTVGFLLSVVGYFSPLPPDNEKLKSATKDEAQL